MKPDQQQTDALLDAQKKAHQQQQGSFKDEALTDKVVSVEPDGTGPSSTQSLDTDTDRKAGSGSK